MLSGLASLLLLPVTASAQTLITPDSGYYAFRFGGPNSFSTASGGFTGAQPTGNPPYIFTSAVPTVFSLLDLWPSPNLLTVWVRAW